jgi:hypothetical protein
MLNVTDNDSTFESTPMARFAGSMDTTSGVLASAMASEEAPTVAK